MVENFLLYIYDRKCSQFFFTIMEMNVSWISASMMEKLKENLFITGCLKNGSYIVCVHVYANYM